MINKTGILYFLTILYTLLLFSCKTAEFGYKLYDVNGMVYDFSNRPVVNCRIIIGGKYTTSTDINGRFTIPRIPIGEYTISGEKPGFESYFDSILIRDRGQIVYFRIPSQNQLLILVDEALSVNNFTIAEEMAERAYIIDDKNIEMLFYYAVVKYKQDKYEQAIYFLEIAKMLGSKDIYVNKFLTMLKELQNAN